MRQRLSPLPRGREPGSYIDVAVHCRALAISPDDALGRIRARRPIAEPGRSVIGTVSGGQQPRDQLQIM
jgi:hypothetical protein